MPISATLENNLGSFLENVGATSEKRMTKAEIFYIGQDGETKKVNATIAMKEGSEGEKDQFFVGGSCLENKEFTKAVRGGNTGFSKLGGETMPLKDIHFGTFPQRIQGVVLQEGGKEESVTESTSTYTPMPW